MDTIILIHIRASLPKRIHRQPFTTVYACVSAQTSLQLVMLVSYLQNVKDICRVEVKFIYRLKNLLVFYFSTDRHWSDSSLNISSDPQWL